jgi:hypothetical protein
MLFIKSDIPEALISIYSIIIWTMLALFWAAIATALRFLWQTIATKPLQYLSPPNDLYRYVTDLRNYYTASGTPPEQIEHRIVDDIQTLMIEQYTFGAVENQKINDERLRARNGAFQSLIVALILALATLAIILGHKLVRGGSDGPIAIR